MANSVTEFINQMYLQRVYVWNQCPNRAVTLIAMSVTNMFSMSESEALFAVKTAVNALKNATA